VAPQARHRPASAQRLWVPVSRSRQGYRARAGDRKCVVNDPAMTGRTTAQKGGSDRPLEHKQKLRIKNRDRLVQQRRHRHGPRHCKNNPNDSYFRCHVVPLLGFLVQWGNNRRRCVNCFTHPKKVSPVTRVPKPGGKGFCAIGRQPPMTDAIPEFSPICRHFFGIKICYSGGMQVLGCFRPFSACPAAKEGAAASRAIGDSQKILGAPGIFSNSRRTGRPLGIIGVPEAFCRRRHSRMILHRRQPTKILRLPSFK